MFAMLGGDRYWPFSGSVGFFRSSAGPVERVLTKSLPIQRSFRSSSFDAAITDVERSAEAAGVEATFLIPIEGWTVVMASKVDEDFGGFFAARAVRDLHCDYVSVDWMPASPRGTDVDYGVLANARFQHYIHEPWLVRVRRRRRTPINLPHRNERWIQVSDQDGSWDFDLVGPVRPYEEVEHYSARRKADRLPLDVLERYVAGAGVPLHDGKALLGPVTTLLSRVRGLQFLTPTRLRRACGYPEHGVPSSLTRWEPRQ